MNDVILKIVMNSTETTDETNGDRSTAAPQCLQECGLHKATSKQRPTATLMVSLSTQWKVWDRH